MSTLNGFKGTLKQICDQMTIQPMCEATKQLFDNIKYSIEKVDMSKMPGCEDPRNWNKPSKAVIASDGHGSGCVVSFAGPHLDSEIDAVGRKLEDLGLDDCPEGIWVWEGTYRMIKHESIEYGTDYSTEADGKFREPGSQEWSAIRHNMCPWDPNDWLKNDKILCSKCKIDFSDENLSVNLCYYCFDQEMSAGNGKPEEKIIYNHERYDAAQKFGPNPIEQPIGWAVAMAKKEDEIIMAKYDLCNEQSVTALQQQEINKPSDNNSKIWGPGILESTVSDWAKDKKQKRELAESINRLANIPWTAVQNKSVEIMGDCIAQCLNCVWLGNDGYKCTCESPMMSMDSGKIRKEKENGEAGRAENMKKCFGCRQNLPLGSGRFHYWNKSVDRGNPIMEQIPCTHNPATGVAYDLPNPDDTLWDKKCSSARHSLTDNINPEDYGFVVRRTDLNPRCDCGGEKTRTTHSDWCSKGGTK